MLTLKRKERDVSVRLTKDGWTVEGDTAEELALGVAAIERSRAGSNHKGPNIRTRVFRVIRLRSATIGDIAGETGLTRAQVRGVLNAKDQRGRITKSGTEPNRLFRLEEAASEEHDAPPPDPS